MRVYSRTGDDAVHTTVEVGREQVFIQLRNSDGMIVAHLPRRYAMEIAENLIYALTRQAAVNDEIAPPAVAEGAQQ